MRTNSATLQKAVKKRDARKALHQQLLDALPKALEKRNKWKSANKSAMKRYTANGYVKIKGEIRGALEHLPAHGQLSQGRLYEALRGVLKVASSPMATAFRKALTYIQPCELVLENPETKFVTVRAADRKSENPIKTLIWTRMIMQI